MKALTLLMMCCALSSSAKCYSLKNDLNQFAATSEINSTKNKAAPTLDITGVWRFVSSQPQNGGEYEEMPDTEILKFYYQGKWIHTAYQSGSKKAVFMAGGTYTFDGVQFSETINYHSREMEAIGVVTNYQVTYRDERLHFSGVYQVGKSNPWKVEEYWVKEQ